MEEAEKSGDRADLNAILFVDQLKEYVRASKHESQYLCINRMEGPQVDLFLHSGYMPLKTKRDRESYKQFLISIEKQNSEVMSLLSAGLASRNLPSKCTLDGVLDQFDGVISGGCARLVDKVKSATSHDDEAWAGECLEVISSSVAPSFKALRDYLESEYLPKLPAEIASSKRHPNGMSYYEDCLKFHTTTDYTYDEVHQIGLREVGRIKDEMKSISVKEGYDTLDDYKAHLTSSAEHVLSEPSDLLKHYRDICCRISPSLLKLFHVETLPRTPYQIVMTPPAAAATAPAAYYLAGGGGRPGTFYVNCHEMQTRYLYEADALALHEAIPGHHTQAAVAAEQDELLDFRKYSEDRRYFEAPSRFPFYTGYIEGWGLHCEGLGDELGLYTKSSDKFGRLSMEMLRAARLVVDTGMHALGWSWQKAYEYLLDNTAMSKQDAAVETTRYVTWPGQATAYKIGEIKINELRSKFEAQTEQFDGDIRDFYHVVLNSGAVPLTVLEDEVNKLIERIKAGKPSNFDGPVDSPSSSSSSSSKTAPAGSSLVQDFVSSMTFASWCKCCIVPNTCEVK